MALSPKMSQATAWRHYLLRSGLYSAQGLAPGMWSSASLGHCDFW